jgi:hypothetical protein
MIELFWADIAVLQAMRSILRASQQLAKEQEIWTKKLGVIQ